MSIWVTLSFFAGCLVWIPIAIVMVSLVNWMVMGDVDVLPGIIAIFLALVLGALTVRPPYPEMSIVFFCVTWGMVIFFAPMRAAAQSAQFSAIDREQAQRAYQQIVANPQNVLAVSRISQLLYKKGLEGHAIALLESQVPHMPQTVYHEEHYLLKRWRSLPVPPQSARPLLCERCENRNAPGAVTCTRCGHMYLLMYVGGKSRHHLRESRLLMAWVSVALITAVIPMAARYLPLVGAVAATVVSVAVGTAIVIKAFTQGSEPK